MDDDDDEQLAEIRAQVNEWSSNSNECLAISLVSADGSDAADRFAPAFTYPIFGEEEAIFGYQDLAIHLSFAAHDLKPHVDIKYAKAFPAQGEVRPTDISAALAEFLPADAFGARKADTAAGEFRPPGERIQSYARDGQDYEVWCASLADEQARTILQNMQILVPLFIEGGSILSLEQDWTTQRWKLFLLYHLARTARVPAYSLVGYGTSYRVFTFPDRQSPLQSDLDLFSEQTLEALLPPPSSHTIADTDVLAPPAHDPQTPLDLPSRERLSQFLILPPHQGRAHGQALYNTMYTHLTAPANIREFTVEDPNEAFDDLRDLCDLRHLRHHLPAFASLRINTDIPASALASQAHIPTHLIVDGPAREHLLRSTKLTQRQFDRVVEMHTLAFIPPLHRSRNRITRKEKSSHPHDRAYFFWRLYVKQRLYVFNRDQLVQLEREERVEKLEAALDGVLAGYEGMLEKVGEGGGGRGGDGNGNGNGNGSTTEGATAPPKARKRKVVDSEDEEEGDADGAEPGKKVRVQ
ncbi:hypothetical protein LTR08_006671 [Meristemomyces frigidus]|nr:hypothetical protein LTR08_006671 [Meristemomyces frigidus]